MNSIADLVEVTCGKCRHQYQWNVWLLVDGRERPDLEARFIASELHDFRCPECGFLGGVSAPVVVIGADDSTRVRLQNGVSQERNAVFLAQLVQRAGGPEQASELSRLLESATFEVDETVVTASDTVPDSVEWRVDIPEALGSGGARACRLFKQFRGSGDAQTLADATIAWKAILSTATFRESPKDFRAFAYDCLAMCHQYRYLLTGDKRRAEMAHVMWLTAIAESAPGTEEHRIHANNAGMGQWDWFKRTSVRDRLDEAIRLLSLACDGGCPPGPGLGDSLRNLAGSLFTRFQAGGGSGDLDGAIARSLSAIEMLQPGDTVMVEAMANLGLFLLTQFRETQNPDALAMALTWLRHAIENSSPPLRAVVESNLAEVLLARHEWLREPNDLTESISILRRASAGSSLGTGGDLRILHNLGIALVRQYHESDDYAALDEAAKLFDDADATGDASFVSLARASFGRALAEAYHRTGRPEILDRAIYTLRLAAAGVPAGDPMRSGILHSLGCVLDDRFSRWDRPDDLHEALENLELAVAISEEAGRIDSKLLCSLTIVLGRIYRKSKLETYLDALLTAARAAVEGSRAAPPSEQSAACLALANGLHEAYGASKNPALLLEAIDWTNTAALTAPPNRRFAVNAALADQLRDLYKEQRSAESLHHAVEAYRAAVLGGLPRHPASVLDQAISWLDWAMSRSSWEESIEAARAAVLAADQLQQSQASLRNQGYWREQTAEVHEALAYSLAKCGDLRGAVVAVEAGRARAIYRRLHRARVADAAPPRKGFESHREFVNSGPKWNRTDLSFEDVRRAAGKGQALVYFITLPRGALALVVEPATAGTSGEVHPIWFDGYSAQTSHALLFEDSAGQPEWLVAYLEWRSGTGGQQQIGPVLDALSRAMEMLWSSVIGKVVDHLVTRGFGAAMFLPSPVLSLLPLHAARSHATGRAVLDDLTVCYAPCIASLTPRSEDDQAHRLPSALSVADDRKGGPLPALPFAVIEADLIAAHFCQVTCLTASTTSVAEVCAQLQEADVLHFACHGKTDHENPLSSSLSVANDGELTLGKILELPPQRHRLALLAGCETGLVSLSFLQDGVSLTSGFLMAGCQGIVASLWVLPDWCSALLLCRMFDTWHMQSNSLSEAFREAQLWIRDTTWAEKLSYLRSDDSVPNKLRLAAALEALPELPATDHPFYWAGCVLTGS